MRAQNPYTTNSVTKDQYGRNLVGDDVMTGLVAPPLNHEMDPHKYVEDITKSPTLADFDKPMTSSPYQKGEVISKRFEFSWTGTMKDFATNPIKTKFFAKPQVQIPEGNQLILVSSQITQVQNTSPVPIGVRFEGMPVNHTVVTGSGNDFHLVIPPETRQPKSEKITVYQTQDIPGGFTENDLKGWDAHTASSIAESVVRRDDKAGVWTVASTSPIISTAIGDGLPEESLAVMQSSVNPNVKYVCIKASLGEKYLKEAIDYRNSMPFEDISKISATIYREDGQEWRDALQNESTIGADASLASRVALDYANLPHHVRVSINNNYVCWKIGC